MFRRDEDGSKEEAALSRSGSLAIERARENGRARGIGLVGLGLRTELAKELLENLPVEVDFIEVSPENYMGRGGAARRTLEAVCDAYPVVTHGLSMSLGGSDPIAVRYLDELRAFIDQVKSPWHSDHACMSLDGGRMLHDLLPIPLTRKSAAHVADRVKAVQDRLGVPMAIENVSFYAHAGAPELSEPLFVREICERADCGWLFDVNNAVVNAANFSLDVDDWLAAAPLERVVQIHVAGHEWFDFEAGELVPLGAARPEHQARANVDRLAIDTHGANAQPAVLALLESALARTGPVPIVIERDQNVPPLAELLAEVARVRAIAQGALTR